MERSTRKQIVLCPVLADPIHPPSVPASLQPNLGNTSPFVLAPHAWESGCKELQRSFKGSFAKSTQWQWHHLKSHCYRLSSSASPPFPLSCLLRHDKARALRGSSVFVQLLFTDGTTAKQTLASECPLTALEVETQALPQLSQQKLVTAHQQGS